MIAKWLTIFSFCEMDMLLHSKIEGINRVKKLFTGNIPHASKLIICES